MRVVQHIQQDIHEHIQTLGGYWQPLSSLARLLEEIGELAEALAEQEGGHRQSGLELADIFIISTCLANQYDIDLSAEYAAFKAAGPLKSAPGLSTITIRAGTLARVLNSLAGDKKPKANEVLPALGFAIAHLHDALFDFAEYAAIPLLDCVQTALAKSRDRDKNRFKVSL